MNEQDINESMEMLEAIELDDQHSNKVQAIQGDIVVEEPVKKPLTPYIQFIQHWKKQHPSEKPNISELAIVWKSLTMEQKQCFQQNYRRQKQVYDAKEKGLFPHSRIKAILKSDPQYQPKAQAVDAMCKIAEHFGTYLLEEVKKTHEKGKIDAKHLYQTIGNISNLFFLQCLRPVQESEKKEKRKVEKQAKEEKKEEKEQKFEKSKKIILKKLAPGQTKLTMFLH